MAISFITGSAGGGVKAGTTFSLSQSSVQVGDVLVLCINSIANSTPVLPTDSMSNTWSGRTSGNQIIMTATATAAGTCTITFTGLPSGTWAAEVLAVRGATEPSGVVGVKGNVTSGTDGTVTTGGDTPASGDAVVGIAVYNGPAGDTMTDDSDTLNGTWTAGLKSTVTTGGSATANEFAYMQAKLCTASGAQTFNPVDATSKRAGVIGIIRIPQAVTITTVQPITRRPFNFATIMDRANR